MPTPPGVPALAAQAAAAAAAEAAQRAQPTTLCCLRCAALRTHRQRRAPPAQRRSLRAGAQPCGALPVEPLRDVRQPLRQYEHHARVVRQHVAAAVRPASPCAATHSLRSFRRSGCGGGGRRLFQRVNALAVVPDGGADFGFDRVALGLRHAAGLGVVSAPCSCESAQRGYARAHARRAARKVSARRRRRRRQQRGLRTQSARAESVRRGAKACNRDAARRANAPGRGQHAARAPAQRRAAPPCGPRALQRRSAQLRRTLLSSDARTCVPSTCTSGQRSLGSHRWQGGVRAVQRARGRGPPKTTRSPLGARCGLR